MPDVAFDRFYRYDELTEILQGWAQEHPELLPRREHRHVVRGPGHLAGDRHELRHRRRPGKARADGRGEHPRHRGDRLHGCAPPARQAAPRLRERPEDHEVPRHAGLLRRARGSIPTVPSSRSPTSRASSARASGRTRATTSRTGSYEEDLDGDGRILMMRVADPNGAWKAHPDDAAPAGAARPRRGPADGTYYRLLPGRARSATTTASRSRSRRR